MPRAVNFDGSVYFSGTPTISVPITSGVMGYWYKARYRREIATVLFGDDGGNNKFVVRQNGIANSFLNVLMKGPEGTVELQSTTPLRYDGEWNFVGIAWRADEPGNRVVAWESGSFLTMNKISGVDVPISINPSGMTWRVGGSGNIGEGFDGAMAEFWFVAGNHTLTDIVELSLIDSIVGGGFQTLPKGDDGIAPLGIAPHIYLHGDAAHFPGNFAVVNGPLTTNVDEPEPQISAVNVALSNTRGIARVVVGKLTREENSAFRGHDTGALR